MLQRRVSCRDSTSCPWNSTGLGLQILYNSAVGPFAQARDAAQQEEEEEHADPNLRKVTIKRRKKGLHSSTKMDFYET